MNNPGLCIGCLMRHIGKEEPFFRRVVMQYNIQVVRSWITRILIDGGPHLFGRIGASGLVVEDLEDLLNFHLFFPLVTTN